MWNVQHAVCERALIMPCSVISSFNLTVLNSAVPNHIRPGLGGGSGANEKRHIRTRQRRRGGEERAAGGGGVPEEPAEVHSPGRKAAKRWKRHAFWDCINIARCRHSSSSSPLLSVFRCPLGWPPGDRKDPSCQSRGRRGGRALLLRLRVRVWRNVRWSWG